jgi:peptidoglycan/xylan/chitin deacetylase (PgdA/CDA1 family)
VLAHFLSLKADEKRFPIEVTLTFDDFPMGESEIFGKVERAQIFADKLSQLNVRAVFFCIGEQMESEGGKESLSLVADQHFLANHTFSHPHLSGCSLEQFKEEIGRTEELLSCHSNFRKWFRFPYLDYGDRTSLGGTNRKRTAAFLLLQQAGYQHAYITINTFDWHVDARLKNAVKEGKEVQWDQLKKAYLSLLEEWIESYHSRWTQVLKRDFAHVLLLHQNDLNAIFLEDIVHLIKEKHWEIVSPEKAFDNPIPYLSKFANTKVRLFKGVPSLSIQHVDEVLLTYRVFKGD